MNSSHYYPRLIKRVRALLIDSLIIPIAAMSFLVIGESLGVASVTGKLVLLILPIFLLEPVMLSMTKGTIGHHLAGIKVTRKNGIDKLNIVAATARFFVRLFFGWFSFVFVFITKRHQAIHDLVARSIVTYRDVSGLPQYDVLHERSIEEAGFVYPAAWKRILAIFLYGFVSLVVIAVAGSFALSDDCFEYDICVGVDNIILMLTDVLSLLLIGTIIVMGWKGRLLGFRRKTLSSNTDTNTAST